MTHFTAVIEVVKRIKEPVKRDRYNNIESPEINYKSEVARIVVRAETIAALKEKIAAHVALLSD